MKRLLVVSASLIFILTSITGILHAQLGIDKALGIDASGAVKGIINPITGLLTGKDASDATSGSGVIGIIGNGVGTVTEGLGNTLKDATAVTGIITNPLSLLPDIGNCFPSLTPAILGITKPSIGGLDLPNFYALSLLKVQGLQLPLISGGTIITLIGAGIGAVPSLFLNFQQISFNAPIGLSPPSLTDFNWDTATYIGPVVIGASLAVVGLGMWLFGSIKSNLNLDGLFKADLGPIALLTKLKLDLEAKRNFNAILNIAVGGLGAGLGLIPVLSSPGLSGFGFGNAMLGLALGMGGASILLNAIGSLFAPSTEFELLAGLIPDGNIKFPASLGLNVEAPVNLRAFIALLADASVDINALAELNVDARMDLPRLKAFVALFTDASVDLSAFADLDFNAKATLPTIGDLKLDAGIDLSAIADLKVDAVLNLAALAKFGVEGELMMHLLQIPTLLFKGTEWSTRLGFGAAALATLPFYFVNWNIFGNPSITCSGYFDCMIEGFGAIDFGNFATVMNAMAFLPLLAATITPLLMTIFIGEPDFGQKVIIQGLLSGKLDLKAGLDMFALNLKNARLALSNTLMIAGGIGIGLSILNVAFTGSANFNLASTTVGLIMGVISAGLFGYGISIQGIKTALELMADPKALFGDCLPNLTQGPSLNVLPMVTADGAGLMGAWVF